MSKDAAGGFREFDSSFFLSKNIRIDPVFRQRDFEFDNSLVFVMMPFCEPWSDRIWEKISEIITNKGLRAERADNRYGPIITEDIWSAVVECRVIICDITGLNANVFYELGIAHTIGKDVILLTQSSTAFPFDTQGFRHLIYTDNPAGMRLLEEELPKMLDHHLSRRPKVRRVYPGFSVPKKRELKAAWQLNAKGWDPQYPPTSHQRERTKLGRLKNTMKVYAWAFSFEEMEAFLSEIRAVWPSSWENMDREQIRQTCDAIEEIVYRWRGGVIMRPDVPGVGG